MKKINKKTLLVLGSVVLAFGLMAVPAIADIDQNTKTKTPGNTQSFMNSGAMQSMHNLTAMQEAMTTGDISKMRDAMNSSEIKAQLDEDLVNQMNQMMSDTSVDAMHGGQGSNMMGSGAQGMMGDSSLG